MRTSYKACVLFGSSLYLAVECALEALGSHILPDGRVFGEMQGTVQPFPQWERTGDQRLLQADSGASSMASAMQPLKDVHKRNCEDAQPCQLCAQLREQARCGCYGLRAFLMTRPDIIVA